LEIKVKMRFVRRMGLLKTASVLRFFLKRSGNPSGLSASEMDFSGTRTRAEFMAFSPFKGRRFGEI
jgi:hypothetical protein